jgi:hypothetical protein
MRATALVLAVIALGACTSKQVAAKRTTTTLTGTSHALPLGDGKYTTSPTRGFVDSCITQFNGGGAFRDGPWIDAAAKTWDAAKKIAVLGSVQRRSEFKAVRTGSSLEITGNGLTSTPTGTFPVQSTDPAYAFDRNPNVIRPSTLKVDLPYDPVVAGTPSCVGGTIGVSVLGAPIFSAFDALGRDAGAHEVQDACGGHPEITGQYHFHTLSPCFSAKDGLFGYALDGFGIYVEPGVTSADLDECHGRTSQVTWHGKPTTVYHYVATADFPYLVACYRGTPVTSAQGLQIGGPGPGGPGPGGPGPGGPP